MLLNFVDLDFCFLWNSILTLTDEILLHIFNVVIKIVSCKVRACMTVSKFKKLWLVIIRAWYNQLFSSKSLLIPSLSAHFLENLEKNSAYYRPLSGATIASSLVPWVLKNIFSLKMVKNNMCLGIEANKTTFFSKTASKERRTCVPLSRKTYEKCLKPTENVF